MVPSRPMATPRGLPGSDQRRTIFLSFVGMGVRLIGSAARRLEAANTVSSPTVNLLLDRVGEIFDNRIGEEPFTHLTQVGFNVSSGLLTIRKRDTKQFSHPYIFHASEAEGGEGMLDGFALRIEDRRLEGDGDGSSHDR
jgi:hypothetical protein